MQFNYTARDPDGKEASGAITAASKLEAADKLFNEKKLNVVSLEQVGGSDSEKNEEESNFEQNEKYFSAEKKSGNFMNSLNNYFAAHSKVKGRDKAVVFRLLSVMINAGLSIVKAIKILSKQSDSPRLKLVLTDVAEKVESGISFSEALSFHDDIFGEAEIGIVKAGEASGQLNKTLVSLAEETEKAASLSKKIRSAMIYPIVVITILIAAVILVMVMVVPGLKDLFSGTGTELPLATKILVGTSDWFVASDFLIPNWLLFVLLIAGSVIFVSHWKKTPSGHFLWDKIMLHLPVFGTLVRKSALASFSRQLALLSNSGVSIVRSLEIASKAIGNEVYHRRLTDVKADVERGISINKSIESDPLFPELMVGMIAVGEQTAQLGAVTEKVAAFYDEEVDTFVKNLSTIMEPIIMVVIGALVGGLVMAIIQPIMGLTDVASSL